MSSRDDQALLVRNLNLLRVWIEKTQWERKTLPPGLKKIPDAIKKHMQTYAEALGDRCQYNLGWHDAQQGVALEEFRSTEAINSELTRLIETIEQYGKSKRRRGQPEKTAESAVDLHILEQYTKNNPRKKSLEHFIDKAVKARDLPIREPGSHAKRIRGVEKARKGAPMPPAWSLSDDMETFAKGLNADLARRGGLVSVKVKKKKAEF